MAGPTVTSRVIAILAAFSAEHVALTLSQLSRRAALPLTTTHRLVGELAALGALERDERGRYRIGVRLWEIASLAPRTVGLRESAMPFLEDLYDATRQNVQLAVLDGGDVLFVERMSARNAIPVVSRVGGRLPLHATAVGQVLLAHASVELQEQVLAGPLASLTDKTITSARRLRTVLAEVRRTGVAITDGQVESNSLSVAAPIYGPSDSVVAGLSIVVPTTEQAPWYVPAVRSAARGISRALGAPRASIRPSSAILGSAPTVYR
ncbi:MAG TPA: IclR family transcriptional regulator [Pseudonocardiaceae bacterium]|nr:IclR family transcriptional regulator [Pseudonocardiaceae bacterium]